MQCGRAAFDLFVLSMDFVGVPAGTAPAAALTLRGSDHDVEFATDSDFNVTLGAALGSGVRVLRLTLGNSKR